MAAREMNRYIDGTSALKMDDGQDRFTVLPGGRRPQPARQSYFSDDLRILRNASGIDDFASSMGQGSASGASRICPSIPAVLGSCFATFVFGMLLVL